MHEYHLGENFPHDYRVTKIELPISGSSTSDALDNSENTDFRNTSISAAKLLQNVEKSYDKGKKLLEESKSTNEARMSVRGDGGANGGEPGRGANETLDVWRSGMGLREKISAAMNVLAGIIGKNDKDLTADDRKDISLKAINTRP